MSIIDPDMKVTRLANWFGSDAEQRDEIAKQLAGRPMVVIPFAGGMSILPVLDAAKIIVNDKHRALINLTQIIQRQEDGTRLYRHLRRCMFDPEVLAQAQKRCAQREESNNDHDGQICFEMFGENPEFGPETHFQWAVDYFVTTWMGRGGSSGTDGEFNGKLPVRYSPNGGGSAQRFHNAVASIPAWRRILRRCEITCEDAFDVLDKTHDSPRVAIYIDAPWCEEGGGYKHKFTITDHRRLAAKLAMFEQSRVVVRYGDCALVRELYPTARWNWIEYDSRSQANKVVREVLIVSKGVGQ